ncbi:restriction endonuclease [Halopenitus persicus]|uniref:Restriction endonuclease n=1 Tax=Halopenitus persicus TaxID=1048396 RepID=A0A1H3FJ91_9EURY|nr:restriction endonuclease [Halopenitus persicus]SDX91066.1 Restriction endonuclease [Halopenitus persicus]
MDVTEKELLKKLQDMDEYEFEEFVADLWEKQGWSTTVTSGSNDGGVDVIAEKDTPFHQKQLIQAKRYSSRTKVGRPDIQQYSSLRHQTDNVDAVVVVTTGDFTPQAEEAAGDLNVKTVNRERLISMIKELKTDEMLRKYIPSETENNSKVTLSDSRDRSKEDILNQAIRLSKRNSGTVYVTVYLDGSNSGYVISPQLTADVYNCHGFINESNTIGKFDTQDWEKIKSIAHRNGLEVVGGDAERGGRLFVGRTGGRTPEADEILRTMSEFLSEVFSVSPQFVDLFIQE